MSRLLLDRDLPSVGSRGRSTGYLDADGNYDRRVNARSTPRASIEENFFAHIAAVGRVITESIFVGRNAEERPTSMMTALALICSLANTPIAMDCGAENAVDVIRVPGEYHSLVTCFTRAQAFVGESRYELTAEHYLKVVCGKPSLPANVG
jgi:hypothetical protein